MKNQTTTTETKKVISNQSIEKAVQAISNIWIYTLSNLNTIHIYAVEDEWSDDNEAKLNIIINASKEDLMEGDDDDQFICKLEMQDFIGARYLYGKIEDKIMDGIKQHSNITVE